jgi:hypothetical protein
MKTLEELVQKVDGIAKDLKELREFAMGESALRQAKDAISRLRNAAEKLEVQTLAESQGKLLAALNEHDEWAKANNAEAKAEHGRYLADHEKKQKEWREAAQSIAGLLLRLHERIDKLEAWPRKAKKRKR